MKFTPMIDLLKKAAAGGYAVPSFCVWNAETAQAVLKVATRLRAPVILMNGPGEFPLLAPGPMAAVIRAVAQDSDQPVALHLDHGDSLDQVRECLAAGYSSVMLDFSTKRFEENAGALKQVVEWARPLGATVEGEIGSVGRVDTVTKEGGSVSTLTDPEEARAYVEATGVDALAVAIGNAHGIYTKLPELDFARLEQIRERVRIPLVLHGGSGTPEADLQKAIRLGVAKVNVASELVRAVRESLREQWNSGKNLWVPGNTAEAVHAMEAVVEKWIRWTGAEGKA